MLLMLLVLLLLVPAALLMMVVTTESGLQMATGTVDRIGRPGRSRCGSGVSAARWSTARTSVTATSSTAMPISSPRDISGRLELLPLLVAAHQRPRRAHRRRECHRAPGQAGRPARHTALPAPLMRLDVERCPRRPRCRSRWLNGTDVLSSPSIAATVTILPKQIRVHRRRPSYQRLRPGAGQGGCWRAPSPWTDRCRRRPMRPQGLPDWQITADFDGDSTSCPAGRHRAPFHAAVDGAATDAQPTAGTSPARRQSRTSTCSPSVAARHWASSPASSTSAPASRASPPRAR